MADADSAIEEVGLEVGDTIIILGGKLNKTVGKLYGFSENRMSILPKGVTDRIIKINLIEGAPDPSLEITDIIILNKAPRPGFITMVDMRAGQYIESFDADSDPAGIFKVISVNEEEDSAVFQDESGGETEISFGFTGIPQELPYEVIRTREAPVSEAPTSTNSFGPVSRVEVEEDDALEGQVPSAEEDKEEVAQAHPVFSIGEEIELPADEELEEISTAERVYDDVFQRSEMLSQMIRLLPMAQQRDPARLQEIRRYVEQMILLRNNVVKYGVTGDPSGIKPTSITTLAELITKPDVYLSRKIANILRVVYLDHTEKHTAAEASGEKGEDPPIGLIEEGIYGDYLIDILKRAKNIQESATGTNEATGAALGMPSFFLEMEKYRQQIQTPYILEGQGIPVEKDEEVFRREIPNFEEPELNALSIIGPPIKGVVPSLENPPVLIQVPYATTRLLAKRVSRFLTGETLRNVEPAESSSYTNILVFPLKALRDMGPIRSGILAQDMSLGSMDSMLVEDIIKNLGEISDFPSADSILNLGVKGNIIGNVTIKDWLTNLKLRIDGAGDSWQKLRGYGAQNIEWNSEQMSVIQEKVQQHLASLRIFMAKQREVAAAAATNLKFEPQPVLAAGDSARLLSRIESEPLLQKVLTDVRGYMGELADIDINWFTYIFIAYPDLLLATLGQQSHSLVRQRMMHVRDLYIQATMNGYRIKKNLQEAGAPPEPNPCPHIKGLLDIRKVTRNDEPRDVTKIKLLVKLLNDYRGKTEDNWVWCNKCDEHLICAHELIQIQEFLRPTEEETLHKEMIIKFSGGQFSGKFICSVCGQAIADMDFDTSLEFDDEGRPMMGRSVMVDREAIQVDELDDLLKGSADIIEEINFGNDNLNEMYKTLKKTASLLGVNPDESEYRSMINSLSTYISTIPTRDAYVLGTKGKKVQDYDIYYSVRYVSAAAAILLLNIQTRIPDYIVYYTTADCKDGFYGYPLESEDKQTGIQCIASIVAGINDNEFPWNMTTLQKQQNLVKRRDLIQPMIKGQIDALIKHPIQQALLKKKREYRTKLFGKIGGTKGDQISQTFRPVPFLISEEDAAKDMIVSDGASPEKQATSWIRQAHVKVRTAAALNPDAPLTETTCCLYKVSDEKNFWESAASSMTSLEKKTMHIRQGSLTTTFYTEKPKTLEGRVDPKDYYKLFVNLCYQGVNKGLPHKLGLTLTCSECGINFKQNPRLPLSLDANPKKAGEESSLSSADIQAHIISQGIIMNEQSAQDLLTTAHLRTKVDSEIALDVPKQDETFAKLSEFSPIEGWAAILNRIHVSLLEIGSGATRIQIVTSAEELVEIISEKENFIRSRLGNDVFRYIESLTKKTPRECGEAVSAFLLVPFQRWLVGFDIASLNILNSYQLSYQTVNDIMIKGLGNYLKPVGDEMELKGLLLRKVRLFVKELSYICIHILPSLRSIMTPGGSIIVTYLLRAYIMGIIQRFMDPHHIPESDGDEEIEGVVNMKLLYRALAQALTKYAVGNKIPSEEEIRISLEKRVEKEKQEFILQRERMNRDERNVERMLKTLGMGKWSVGGTKAIRQYDADRYEVERAERAAAGIVDYVDVGAANAADAANRPMDLFGTDFGGDYDAGAERMDGDYTDGAMKEDEY